MRIMQIFSLGYDVAADSVGWGQGNWGNWGQGKWGNWGNC